MVASAGRADPEPVFVTGPVSVTGCTSPEPTRHWYVDGNNVFGSKPDGWWNDRAGAMARFTDRVARWCRTHDDSVTVVFDRPVPDAVVGLGGGNLRVVPAERSGRNAADATIVDLVNTAVETAGPDSSAAKAGSSMIVVTSDRGLRARLPDGVEIWGVGRFRSLIDY